MPSPSAKWSRCTRMKLLTAIPDVSCEIQTARFKKVETKKTMLPAAARSDLNRSYLSYEIYVQSLSATLSTSFSTAAFTVYGPISGPPGHSTPDAPSILLMLTSDGGSHVHRHAKRISSTRRPVMRSGTERSSQPQMLGVDPCGRVSQSEVRHVKSSWLKDLQRI